MSVIRTWGHIGFSLGVLDQRPPQGNPPIFEFQRGIGWCAWDAGVATGIGNESQAIGFRVVRRPILVDGVIVPADQILRPGPIQLTTSVV